MQSVLVLTYSVFNFCQIDSVSESVLDECVVLQVQTIPHGYNLVRAFPCMLRAKFQILETRFNHVSFHRVAYTDSRLLI